MRSTWLLALLFALGCVGGHDSKDSDTDTDTHDPAPFACGELSCDATTQYCLEWTGGIPDTAGEAVVTFSCEPIPEGCLDTPTCACLESALSEGEVLTCELDDGALRVGSAGA